MLARHVDPSWPKATRIELQKIKGVMRAQLPDKLQESHARDFTHLMTKLSERMPPHMFRHGTLITDSKIQLVSAINSLAKDVGGKPMLKELERIGDQKEQTR